MTHLSMSSQSCSATIGGNSSACSSSLDLTAILQASQALSSEIEIDKLFSTLLRTVVQMTGASRCVLILLEQDCLMVQATAQATESGQIEIQMQPRPLQDYPLAPIALVEQVRQSLQPAVSLDCDFQADPPNSLLCSPILRQGKLLGMVYLEHPLAGAFTSDHLELFKLLCAQTAISLDNARLYQQSQQALARLQNSEERYRSLITVTSQIIWIATPDGRTVESPNWCTYTGQSLDKLKEFGWLEALHPEDSEQTGRIWNHARETRTWYKTEYRIRGSDGSYRYFDVKGVPILAEDGSIREWIGTCTDIDDRKQAAAALQQRTIELEHTLQELQRTQTQMVQTEKMSSLGQLVAGVAHEINNPVNFIYGNLNHADNYTQDLLRLLDLYQQHYPTPHPEIQQETEAIDLDFLREDLPQLLSSMKVGANRIRSIVVSLRNFSRMDEAEMKAVNIHDGIDSTLMILKHRLKAKDNSLGIDVIKNYGELPEIECYAGQLNQVFMNLLSNAIDALEDALTQQKVSNPTITIATALVNPNEVSISITDNGLGIPALVRQRLFNPFFTTKPVGKGTGMGLSISYQIVTEKHRGQLICHSNPESSQPGATFTVTIPIHQGHSS